MSGLISLLDAAEIDMINKHVDAARRRHPAWTIIYAYDQRVDYRRAPKDYLTNQGVDLISRQRDGDQWLRGAKNRIAQTKDFEECASALAEIRCYGALLEAGFSIRPIPRTKSPTPDFEFDVGGELGIVEVATKLEHDEQTKLAKEIAAGKTPEGVERSRFETKGATVDFTVSERHPFGAPDPEKEGDTTQTNAISRICSIKQKETQVATGKVAILWLDFRDLSGWPGMLKVRDTAALISGHGGTLTSGHFRLPGLGSYLQAAADSGDTNSILLGILTMVAVIVMIDQFVWRPVIAWAEKFKMEQVESASSPTSWVLDFLKRSRGVAVLRKRAIRPLRGLMIHYFGRHEVRAESVDENQAVLWLWRIVGVAALGTIGYAVVRVVMILTGLHGSDFREIGIGLFATWLRVNVTLVLGALWTIPAGVAIGFNPRLARIAQPLAQIAASVPATAVFPVVLLVLIRLGGGLGFGSIVLLLLGTQWYILFNVIAGAMAIPTDLKEAASVFGIRGWERWRKLILPGIFPFLVTGMITASGGAWNVSIVAEYAHLKGQVYSTVGIGAMISAATDAKNFNLLLASTIALAAVVVTTNRLLWRRLYRLAETRFKLEG